MGSNYVVSVSQINEYVGSLLRQDALLRNIGVRGEISGFKRHNSGHLYFSLKDEGALLRCIMFRQNALSCPVSLRDGVKVTAYGEISLYTRDGQYQLYVKNLEEQGEGELYKKFLLQKARLEAKGYFDPAHKKPVPYLPKCIGIVTSQTGAVLQDIRNVLHRRFPTMNLLLCPARVQGEGAAKEIAKAIAALDASGLADVIIVARGGGSMEDLWCFNEEAVADAIYRCRTPVISAVGHETDVTIADFTADLRAPTPSAAAELCTPTQEELLKALSHYEEKLSYSVRQTAERNRMKLNAIHASHGFSAPSQRINTERQRLDMASVQMNEGIRRLQTEARTSLKKSEAALTALDPNAVLKRGYAVLRAQNGNGIDSVTKVKAGENAAVQLSDGRIGVRINEIFPEKGD